MARLGVQKKRLEFDPEKVTLHFFGCCSYQDSWEPGTPFPEGWGEESEARELSYVDTEDYDRLLALYLRLCTFADGLENLPQSLWSKERYRHEAACQQAFLANKEPEHQDAEVDDMESRGRIW